MDWLKKQCKLSRTFSKMQKQKVAMLYWVSWSIEQLLWMDWHPLDKSSSVVSSGLFCQLPPNTWNLRRSTLLKSQPNVNTFKPHKRTTMTGPPNAICQNWRQRICETDQRWKLETSPGSRPKQHSQVILSADRRWSDLPKKPPAPQTYCATRPIHTDTIRVTWS